MESKMKKNPTIHLEEIVLLKKIEIKFGALRK